MDFTVAKYRQLCEALKSSGIEFELRHDIDLKPGNALQIAHVEYESGLTANYYFRYMDIWGNPDIIRQIAGLGHTIGYHYESLTTVRGDMVAAYEDFMRNLDQLRTIAPVTTACAHGSPRSPFNSMDLWKHYDIRKAGIIYEPMLDTDFKRTLYLTDTGRRWDGYRVSIRDRVPEQEKGWQREGLIFHTTDSIIQALNNPQHSIHHHRLLINTHCQRWANRVGTEWISELFRQSFKNMIKRIIVKKLYFCNLILSFLWF